MPVGYRLGQWNPMDLEENVMRWLQRIAVLFAVTTSWGYLPSVSEAGWLTLTSGNSGNVQPTGVSEFWYGSSSTPPLVAVDTVSGAGAIQAVTGGGTSFFTGLGTPVLLNLSDGSAYLAGGSPPTGATHRGPGGTTAGTPTSAAPQTGIPASPDYTRLGVTLVLDGSWALTVSVVGGDGAGLGSGSVIVPESGWWVIGLGSGQQPAPEPSLEPTPIPEPSPAPGVPEPATMALASSGAFLVLPWLRRRCHAANAVT